MFRPGQPTSLFHFHSLNPNKGLHSYLLLLNLYSVDIEKQKSNQTEQSAIVAKYHIEVYEDFEKVKCVHGCKRVSDLTDNSGTSSTPSPKHTPRLRDGVK
jgi:hypothetical protein